MIYRMRSGNGTEVLTKNDILHREKQVLESCISEYISAYHIWYEYFDGYGRPEEEIVKILEEGLLSEGWIDVGMKRFERFGMVRAYQNPNYGNCAKEKSGVLMPLHMFSPGKHYKGPDGKIYWIAIVECFDMRGFEWKDGKYIGSMVEIHPASDYAKQMIEVKIP